MRVRSRTGEDQSSFGAFGLTLMEMITSSFVRSHNYRCGSIKLYHNPIGRHGVCSSLFATRFAAGIRFILPHASENFSSALLNLLFGAPKSFPPRPLAAGPMTSLKVGVQAAPRMDLTPGERGFRGRAPH
jgi:hypothetical protein